MRTIQSIAKDLRNNPIRRLISDQKCIIGILVEKHLRGDKTAYEELMKFFSTFKPTWVKYFEKYGFGPDEASALHDAVINRQIERCREDKKFNNFNSEVIARWLVLLQQLRNNQIHHPNRKGIALLGEKQVLILQEQLKKAS